MFVCYERRTADSVQELYCNQIIFTRCFCEMHSSLLANSRMQTRSTQVAPVTRPVLQHIHVTRPLLHHQWWWSTTTKPMLHHYQMVWQWCNMDLVQTHVALPPDPCCTTTEPMLHLMPGSLVNNCSSYHQHYMTFQMVSSRYQSYHVKI